MKTRAILLAFIAIFCCTCTEAFTGIIEIDGINYEVVTKGKTATIIAKSSGKYKGNIVIPSYIVVEDVECNVNAIGEKAFYECDSLTSITLPQCVTSIGYYSFGGCRGLASISLPNSLISIDDNAFVGCQSLTSITIPYGVTTIGSNAFASCGNIKHATIPNSVTYMGFGVFYMCESLISIDISNQIKNICFSSFKGCKSLTTIIIPQSVTNIDYDAFKDCCSLTSINIPNSVTKIGDGVFSGCRSLSSVSISDSLTTISKNAFYGCSSLSSITLPNSVTSVFEYAFYGCEKLKIIKLGQARPGKYSFADCPEITDVYCYREDRVPSGTDAFINSHIEYATLHVPASSIELYKNFSPWNEFGKIVAIEDDIPIEQCAKPTIAYKNGQLLFQSDTEDVKFVSEITDVDITQHYTTKVNLTATYSITVYATRPGYQDSDVAYATLCWVDAAPQTEGIEDAVVEVKSHPVLIQQRVNQLCVSGAPAASPISIHDLRGQLVTTATAHEGETLIDVLSGGQPLIVKVGNRSVKVKW